MLPVHCKVFQTYLRVTQIIFNGSCVSENPIFRARFLSVIAGVLREHMMND